MFNKLDEVLLPKLWEHREMIWADDRLALFLLPNGSTSKDPKLYLPIGALFRCWDDAESALRMHPIRKNGHDIFVFSWEGNPMSDTCYYWDAFDFRTGRVVHVDMMDRPKHYNMVSYSQLSDAVRKYNQPYLEKLNSGVEPVELGELLHLFCENK